MKEKTAAHVLPEKRPAVRAETDRMAYEKVATWRTAADKVAAAETERVVREK